MHALTRSLWLVVLVGACGPMVPTHAGYGAKDKTPWDRAKKVELNEDGAAKVEGEVNFPDRQRAKWYKLELADPGALAVKMTFDPLQGAEQSDLGIEILDAGFKVLTEIDEEAEQQEGAQKKERSLDDIPPGRYLIHVFARGKTDKADFILKIKFDAGGSGGAGLAVLGPLPAVPPSDDSPKKPVYRPPPDDGPKKPPTPTVAPPPKGGVKARVTEYGDAGGSVRIILDKGSDDGIAQGNNGYLMSSATKKKLAGSEFTIKTVNASESVANVKLSATEVQANKSAIIMTQ